MKQELQEKLYKKYPKLFYEKDLPATQSCMCWGIDCGSGWYNIIDQMCGLIQFYVDRCRSDRARALRWNKALERALKGDKSNLLYYYRSKLGYDEQTCSKIVEEEIQKQNFREIPQKVYQVQFAQIKEKFGTLRVYTNGIDDYIEGIISMAERMSARTCEVCGVPGRTTKGGWSSILCVRCARQEGKQLISLEEEDDDE